MRTTVVLGCVSLVWLASGLVMIAWPTWAMAQVRDKLADPFSRFLLLEGTALTGVLVALSGAGRPQSWFWMGVGWLATAKALILLGLSRESCGWVCNWLCNRSPWVQRVAGVIAVMLATLLAIEAIRKGGTY
jgi:hypothetical protein